MKSKYIESEEAKKIKIALAGNPNSGKTTLFNRLTGSTAHVGNWAGVTVERREGKYKNGVTITDLPGIYSLSPFSPEEKISRDFIIGEYGEQPDVIINIINVMQFERSLYLTTQLLETDRPVIIALNMIDVLEKRSGKIDIRSIEKLFDVPVVGVSALNGENIDELIERAIKLKNCKRTPESVLKDSSIYNSVNNIKHIFEKNNISNPLFHAVKAVEHERDILDKCYGNIIKAVEHEIALAETVCADGDIVAAVADLRYRYICGYAAFLVNQTSDNERCNDTEKIDRIMTHKLFGIPIFFCMMFMIFHLIFSQNLFMLNILSPGVFLKNLIEIFVRTSTPIVSGLLKSAGASDWAASLIADGLWSGVGSVLTFSPQIMMLFLFLSLLEDSGYMARAAFIMDEPLRRFGLSGKSFVPMLMGFGCSVPAIMATRTIENDDDRRITIMLVPFMSCGAKFPIYAMTAAAVFEKYADIIIFAIYFLGILTAAVSGILLRKFLFKGNIAPFIMEMPEYRLPSARVMFPRLWEKLREFFIRAGTLIAAATVVVWLLQNTTLDIDIANMAEPSLLAVIGSFIRPLFIPLGFARGDNGWIPVVSVLTGFVAKEAVVSSLNQLSYSAGMFSPPAALSFMAFNLLCIPCFAAVAAMRKETGSIKIFAFTLFYQFASAWLVSFLIYSFGVGLSNIL